MTKSSPRLSQPARGYISRSRRSRTDPGSSTADRVGDAFAPPHEAVLDVVFRQRVPNGGQLGARVIVWLDTDERAAVEQDDERRDASAAERGQ
jgi:hypothetical protein